MQRRKFLAGAAGAATGLAAASHLPKPAIAQERIEWTMVTPWPKGAPGVGVNAQRAADMITQLSGGRLTVNLFAAGELVPPFEAFDAVSAGNADCLHGTPYYWVGKSASFNWFTGIPFGLATNEFMGWMYFGEGQALWDEAYAPFGVKPFYAGSSGVQAGGWFRREITSLDDMQGLKFRIAGMGGEVMNRLGVQVVLMPPGEIFTAMDSGVIDAAEWVGPWNDLAFGLHRIAKFYYHPAFHEAGPSLEFSVNQASYDALPDDLKELVAAVARANTATAIADFQFNNAVSVRPLVEENGVQFRLWPQEVVDAVRTTSAEVVADVAASEAMATKVNDAYQAFLAQAVEWSRWSDQAYLAARNG